MACQTNFGLRPKVYIVLIIAVFSIVELIVFAPKFAISQSEAVYTVKMSCDIMGTWPNLGLVNT